MTLYPEHEKMKEVAETSQAIGDFLEWASAERGWFLARNPVGDERGSGGLFGDRPVPLSYGMTEVLAQFFDIDLAKVEAEKRQMLEEMRRSNEGRDG